MNYPKKGKVIYLDKDSNAMSVRKKRASKPISKKVMALYVQFENDVISLNHNAITMISAAHEIADEHMKTLSDYIVCQKGCSACCHISVHVSALEANYIAYHYPMLNINKNSSEGFDPREKRPCPFLVDNGCSIYEYRPLVCRMAATYDHPKYCGMGPDYQHWQSTAFQHQPFRLLQENLDSVSFECTEQEPKDIRDWFKK